MYEELTLAVDELRQRSQNQAWFLPVLLDECAVPERPISSHQTLNDLQHVALYEDWNEGVDQLLSVIKPGWGHTIEMARRTGIGAGPRSVAPAQIGTMMRLDTARGGVIVIHVEGQVSDTNADEFGELVDAAYEATGDVLVDFERVIYLDTTGLGLLARLERRLEGSERSIAVVLGDQTAREIFRVTGFERVFRVFDSVEAALRE